MSALLWPLLGELVDEAERLTGLQTTRPTAWKYQELDVRLGAPGLTSGFFGTLFYDATRRHLAHLGHAGFFENPGEARPFFSYKRELEDDHLWAMVMVKHDTPIGGLPPIESVRAFMPPPEVPEGFRWFGVPIARCDGQQAERVKRVHRELGKRLHQDRTIEFLCEAWQDVWASWESLMVNLRTLDAAALFSEECPDCRR